MKSIKVSEATKIQLNWLVAKYKDKHVTLADIHWGNYSPCTDWSQGGPIIEGEGINLSVDYQDDALSTDMVQIGWKGNLWNNSVPGTRGFLQWAYGSTPLIAAMRCYVMSKLGNEVEVPEELL